jgi:hypothetical protein
MSKNLVLSKFNAQHSCSGELLPFNINLYCNHDTITINQKTTIIQSITYSGFTNEITVSADVTLAQSRDNCIKNEIISIIAWFGPKYTKIPIRTVNKLTHMFSWNNMPRSTVLLLSTYATKLHTYYDTRQLN